MKAMFLDTSFLLALAFASDQNHDAAARLYRRLPPSYLTTEYILDEFLDATSGIGSRVQGAEVVALLRQESRVTIVPASTRLFEVAFDLYRQRQDKAWGMTDCISFVVMREQGVTDALTADHHFEQAGFNALLRQPGEGLG